MMLSMPTGLYYFNGIHNIYNDGSLGVSSRLSWFYDVEIVISYSVNISTNILLHVIKIQEFHTN